MIQKDDAGSVWVLCTFEGVCHWVREDKAAGIGAVQLSFNWAEVLTYASGMSLVVVDATGADFLNGEAVCRELLDVNAEALAHKFVCASFPDMFDVPYGKAPDSLKQKARSTWGAVKAGRFCGRVHGVTGEGMA